MPMALHEPARIFRAGRIRIRDDSGGGDDDRIIEFSFSSDEPYRRGYGYEILGHNPGEYDFSRVAQGVTPLLVDHRASLTTQAGMIEKVWVENGRGYAIARLGVSELASDMLARIKDGEIKNISVGYDIFKTDEVGIIGDEPVFRMRWKLFEISLVSIPADASVGVGRDQAGLILYDSQTGGHNMPGENTQNNQSGAQSSQNGAQSGQNGVQSGQNGAQSGQNGAQSGQNGAQSGQNGAQSGQNGARDGQNGARGGQNGAQNPAQYRSDSGAPQGSYENVQSALRQEGQRRSAIRSIGEQHNMSADFIARAENDLSVSSDDFARQVLDQLSSPENSAVRAQSAGHIGLSDQETQRYSMMRAVRHMLNPADERARNAAAFEIECSRAYEDQNGRELVGGSGLFVPPDVLNSAGMRARVMRARAQRAQNTGVNSAGGYLVATDHLGDMQSFIDLIRETSLADRLGVNIINDLVGNLDIPRLDQGVKAEWIGEGEDSSDQELQFGNVKFSPQTLAVSVPIARRMILQSTPAIDDLVWLDTTEAFGTALDESMLFGTGENQPRGIATISGLSIVTPGTAGQVSYSDMVNLEGALPAGINEASTSYVFGKTMQSKLKKTPMVEGAARFIMENREVNGFPAHVFDGSMRAGEPANGWGSTAFFGDWSNYIFAFWTGMQIDIDRATLARSGGTVLRAFQDVDGAARRQNAFAMYEPA